VNPVSATMGNYTVWVRNDMSEIRQGFITTEDPANPNLTVVIRSRGVASDGRTNVVLEATMLPTALVTNTPGASGGGIGDECVAGKNACDDNSSTQYGISFAGN
jgi:hypothetical protein